MRRALLPVLLPLLLAAAPAPSRPVRVAVLSDINGSYGAVTYPAGLGRALAIIRAWDPDALLSAGDLIAGQKAALSDDRVRAMWAAFGRDVRTPLAAASIPAAFALGNHDASLTRDRREAARYWEANAPAMAYTERAAFPFRYSFTLAGGAVFVAVLDATGPNVDAAQRAWLAGQLASAPARGAGVRLVVGHLPLAGVSQDKNRPGEVIREAGALRQVMEGGRVLAYIHGHHAAYYPGRLGGLNVLASGGIGGRDYIGHPDTARSTVTLLTLWPGEGRATFETVDVDTGKAVATDSLPARLDGLGGPLVRVGEFR